ncbi:MAG: hypothetical protein IJP23_01790 [Oscillospiraceae bacterium]|nr:hypothetical protein [Oscillospiraceae bacterium]
MNEASAAAGRQARLGFFLGEGGRLVSRVPMQAKQGEIMVLFDNGCRGPGNPEALASQIVREAVRRGFSGVVADFEGVRNSFLTALISAMESGLYSRGKSLYVPEQYAPVTAKSKILIPSALSGGSLKGRLQEAAGKWGAGRLALECQRVRESFPLPSRSGSGEPLTGPQLRRIREKYRPACFFSAPLCAYYFTYRNEAGKTRFVLFDDSVSMARKINTAKELGINDAFLLFAEIEDIFPDLVRRMPG